MRALPTGPVFAAWDGIDRGPLERDFTAAALRRARNDLQPGAIRLCPPIAEVLDALSACPGIRLCRMSGSGATCFAVFESEDASRTAHDALARLHPEWWLDRKSTRLHSSH